MFSSVTAPLLTDSHLIELLNNFGLATRYVRAAGNTLYYRDADGEEVPVLDCASGFGSLIFGHNNPEIVAHTKALLDAQVPVHTQFSGYSRAIDVAAALNNIIRRESGTDDRYFALFGNSGAEAIEIAIKHAELDRGVRIARQYEEIDTHIEDARTAVRAGRAKVAKDPHSVIGQPPSMNESEGFERLVTEVIRRNAETSARAPLFLAMEGGFHGKLVCSVQLTYNEDFRTPFKLLAAQARFIPLDQPDLMWKIIEQEQAFLFDVVVTDGVVDLVARDFPVIGAFVVEPILGEAGVRPITPALAGEIRKACDTLGCPLISDEIQSGMGRSGTFLAGTQVGLRPDYIVLAKSLGGGIAKTGAVLVHESRYHKDFELRHTSTFGKDGLSSLIALKVLEMLESNNGEAYRLAEERGIKAKTMMEAVLTDFPDVLKEVRGTGLMLGVEFQDQSNAKSATIREWVDAHVLTFLMCGYLLHKHRIRILFTASSLNTLRFEPSIYLTDTEIDQVEAALRDVCMILRDQDTEKFLNFSP